MEATKDIPNRSKNAGIVDVKKSYKLVERFPELKTAKKGSGMI